MTLSDSDQENTSTRKITHFSSNVGFVPDKYPLWMLLAMLINHWSFMGFAEILGVELVLSPAVTLNQDHFPLLIFLLFNTSHAS